MTRRETGRLIEASAGEQPGSRWEMFRAAPAPPLQPFVVGSYVGWVEHCDRPLPRREVATLRVPLIFSFGAPYEVRMAGTTERTPSFVAGVSSVPAIVTGSLTSCALQVDLTPLGAYSLLGLPLHVLSNRVIPVADVLGPSSVPLIERLQETAGWSARFDLIDAFLIARLGGALEPDRRLATAWQRLAASGGRMRVSTLAREVGWSRKHLNDRFLTGAGLSPKMAARVMRFEHLTACSAHLGRKTWGQLANECGYFDQAHLNLDFAEFAGTTPTQWLRERVPAADTALALGPGW